LGVDLNYEGIKANLRFPVFLSQQTNGIHQNSVFGNPIGAGTNSDLGNRTLMKLMDGLR